jgi:hypothetical protein
VVGSCECGDEPSGSGPTELVRRNVKKWDWIMFKNLKKDGRIFRCIEIISRN